MLGTGALPVFVPEDNTSLTADQVKERMRQLEERAPGYSFKDRETVRNRHTRTSVPRATKIRSLQTAMNLKLQEFDREQKVHDIDTQWLECRTHLNDIRIADRRRVGAKSSRE